MSNASLAPVQNGQVSIIEDVIAKGDLAKLTGDERARYYAETCRSMGLNPLTKPFDYITLNGKMTLYATKTATDQLRTIRGVSVYKVEAETTTDGVRIVTAYARDSSGREDMDLGAVNVKGLQGEALANAYMKALTKAKRRVTLSICGLGWVDESEIETINDARRITVDHSTGEIIDAEPTRVQVDVVDDFITREQMDQIKELVTLLALTPADVKAIHGKPSAKQLTTIEANALIGRLLDMRDGTGTEEEPAAESDTDYMARMLDGDTGNQLPGMTADPDRFTA